MNSYDGFGYSESTTFVNRLSLDLILEFTDDPLKITCSILDFENNDKCISLNQSIYVNKTMI